MLITRATTSAFDALVALLTLTKTFKMKKQASAFRMSSNLVDLLLLDGTLYFVALFALNLAQIMVSIIVEVSCSIHTTAIVLVNLLTFFGSLRRATSI
ncbi:hypothetical protein EIP86_009379 [Pleurotus ostreatoroseus]|nr:hypothetical protein EIP86_009379 [Pleurotus ostreatoroseus]